MRSRRAWRDGGGGGRVRGVGLRLLAALASWSATRAAARGAGQAAVALPSSGAVPTRVVRIEPPARPCAETTAVQDVRDLYDSEGAGPERVELELGNGTYGPLLLRGPVALRAAVQRAAVITGCGRFRALDVDLRDHAGGGALVVIEGLVLTDGRLKESAAAAGSDGGEGDGGAVVFRAGGAQGAALHLRSCTLARNSAVRGGALAFHAWGTARVVLEEVVLDQNAALHWGGAVYVDAPQGEVSMRGVSFTRNHARLRGGSVHLRRGTLTCSSCAVEGCFAELSGGFLQLAAGVATFSDLRLDGVSSREGGAFYQDSGSLSIRGLVAANTSASSTGGLGYQAASGSAELRDASVSSSAAGREGGVWASWGALSASALQLADARSGGDGGSFFLGGGSATLDEVLVDSSTARVSGGFLYGDGAVVRIRSLVIRGRAEAQLGSGGALLISGGSLRLDGARVRRATALGSGGLLCSRDADVAMSNVSASGTESSGIGGALAFDGGRFLLQDSTFGSCHAGWGQFSNAWGEVDNVALTDLTGVARFLLVRNASDLHFGRLQVVCPAGTELADGAPPSECRPCSSNNFFKDGRCQSCQETYEVFQNETAAYCSCPRTQAPFGNRCVPCLGTVANQERSCPGGLPAGSPCGAGHDGHLCAACQWGYHGGLFEECQPCYSLGRRDWAILFGLVVACLVMAKVIWTGRERMYDGFPLSSRAWRMAEFECHIILLLWFVQLLGALVPLDDAVAVGSKKGPQLPELPYFNAMQLNLGSLLRGAFTLECWLGPSKGAAVKGLVRATSLPVLVCLMLAGGAVCGNFEGGLEAALFLLTVLSAGSVTGANGLIRCIKRYNSGDQIPGGGIMEAFPTHMCDEQEAMGLKIAGYSLVVLHWAAVPALLSWPLWLYSKRVALQHGLLVEVQFEEQAVDVRIKAHGKGYVKTAENSDTSAQDIRAAIAAYGVALCEVLGSDEVHVRQTTNGVWLHAEHQPPTPDGGEGMVDMRSIRSLLVMEGGPSVFDVRAIRAPGACATAESRWRKRVLRELRKARPIAVMLQERAALCRAMEHSLWLRSSAFLFQRYAYGRAVATEALLKVLSILIISLASRPDTAVCILIVAVSTSVLLELAKPFCTSKQNHLAAAMFAALGFVAGGLHVNSLTSGVVPSWCLRTLTLGPVVMCLWYQWRPGDSSLRALAVWNKLQAESMRGVGLENSRISFCSLLWCTKEVGDVHSIELASLRRKSLFGQMGMLSYLNEGSRAASVAPAIREAEEDDEDEDEELDAPVSFEGSACGRTASVAVHVP